MPELSQVIAATINEWNNPFIEFAIFDTADPLRIAERLDAFCRSELGSSIAEGLFYKQSQGAVFGLALKDGRRIVVKAHQPKWSLNFLDAIYQIQSHLANCNYPCPRPLIAPKPLGRGHAMVMELIDVGTYADAHDPAIRHAMAELLFLLVDLTRDFRNLPGLQPGMLNRLPKGVLWPTPHSNIFDFEAAAAGAEWIDNLARQARQTLQNAAGEYVIGHIDWSVKDFRFENGIVRVIYDWDSLALDRETIIVGEAARGFTSTWHLDVRIAPGPEEAQAFVHEYEAAREKSFTITEWNTIAAAATYAMAYSARCEHSLEPRTSNFPEGSYREALARYGASYLAP